MAIPDEIIRSKMYFIRGCKVMLDSDLAELKLKHTVNQKEK